MGKAKAYKTKSGKYRCRATWYDIEGKQHSKSFTAKYAKDAEKLRNDFLKEIDRREENYSTENITLKLAAEKYIENNLFVLSPSTIKGYEKIKNNALTEITNIKLSKITPEMYQKSINKYAETRSPKTTRNANNFFKKVMKTYGVKDSFFKNINLPQKEESEIKIPSTEEVTIFLNNLRKEANEKEQEHEILLFAIFAVSLGLRRSEIYGIKYSDIDMENRTIRIFESIVKNKDNEFVRKTTKTIKSKRTLKIPDILYNELLIWYSLHDEEIKTNVTIFHEREDAVYSKYHKRCKKYEFPYSPHSLRHYFASLLLSEKIPNKYSTTRMGHSSDRILQKTYQHLFEAKINEHDIIINNALNKNFKGVFTENKA